MVEIRGDVRSSAFVYEKHLAAESTNDEFRRPSRELPIHLYGWDSRLRVRLSENKNCRCQTRVDSLVASGIRRY